MRPSRYAVFGLLIATAPSLPAVSADRILVVCPCSVEAYNEALRGIADTVGREPTVINPASKNDPALSEYALHNAGRIFIAIGREAFNAGLSIKPAIPLIGTMILHDDAGSAGPAASEIDLDVPPRLLLQELRRLFPDYVRVGVLVSGNVNRAALAAAARESGIQLLEREVGGPADLVKVFLSVKGKVDMVVTLPNTELYNSATIQPLILASLESGIPIVGFSAAFVRAGAAAGIFADFREAGRQAAEAAMQYDPGRAQQLVEQPRKLTVAVNQRVTRLLGLKYQPGERLVVYK